MHLRKVFTNGASDRDYPCLHWHRRNWPYTTGWPCIYITLCKNKVQIIWLPQLHDCSFMLIQRIADTWAKVLHVAASQFSSFIHTWTLAILMDVTNCPITFVLWYAQFYNKNKLFSHTIPQAVHWLLHAQADVLYLKVVTNCPIIFVLWYAQFYNKNKLFNHA